MSFKSILLVAALAGALLNPVYAQSSTVDSSLSVTQVPSNTTSTLPTYTTSLLSTPLTNTTSTPCTSHTAPSQSNFIYPLLNTTVPSNHTSPPARSTNVADVTTKIIVTATADGIPTSTEVAPSNTECAGPSCTGVVSAASKKERLVDMLGSLALVAGAFALFL
ncbi:hypothetical protein BKA64DRAFT_268783 [Cadophora sp. MPI-SDFR-AT-0126]|nr:hypothetical protein BKA64DRAFT_268783 [Leotiomycetes sp. MPI-SDFR-AT-0126]